MATRLYLSPDRMILSKPGQNASPSLANQHKILDSDWGYAGLVGEIIGFDDPAPPGFDSQFLTGDSSLVTIPFSRTYPFVPSVLLSFYSEHTAGAAFGGGIFTEPTRANAENADIPPPRWRVYNDRATFQRFSSTFGGGSPYFRYAQPLMLVVFAW